MLNSLPGKAKEIYDLAYASSNSERVALEAVKIKCFHPRVVAKSSKILPKIYHAKSALSDSQVYFAEFIFADVKEDLDGDKIPTEVLCTKINGMTGDLEHANLFRRNEVSDAPLFNVVNSFFDGDNLVGTVRFESDHPQFANVWEYCEKGEFGISLEYDGLEEVVGITGTVQGRNPRSKIINAYKA